MKHFLLVIVPLLLVACSSGKYSLRAGDNYVDDIYYCPFDAASQSVDPMPVYDKNIKEIIFIDDTVSVE